MNVDPVFALPCPDDTDAGALALYMQRLAEAVEATLLAERTAIRRAYRPPCAIWRSVNTSGPISNSGFSNLTIDGSSGLVFANYGIQFLPPNGAFFPPSVGEGNQMFSEPGLWCVGYAVKCTETGGVSPGTGRLINAVVYQDQPAGPVIKARLDQVMVQTAADANAYTTVQATVPIGDDIQNWHLAMQFTHTNAASTVQITAGDLVVWAYKTSGDDQIEVS